MKEILGLVVVVFSGLGAVFGVIGGTVLLNTFHIAFGIMFALKILIVMGVLVMTLSWWTVILVPIAMFVGGWLCIGIGILFGAISASILENM